ncbi:uncharacterized protein LOC143240357 isoform X1 [Tachypleus tridentatus]|uniref:uncharacterized protein LOC143240357 isoform X1 n=1 Tax=Tachypleus tridentatus TaxID=6853 RepID=UPI003FCFB03E
MLRWCCPKFFSDTNHQTLHFEKGSCVAMGFNYVMFLGSVREGRNVSRVAKYMENVFESNGHHVTVFDPQEMEFPMLKKPLHFYRPNEQPPDWLVKYNKIIQDADGYVVISAEYNRSIPPALTNMMNHFPPASYKYKPCGIVCYSLGPAGGIVAAMALRPFLGELGMVTPSFIFATPQVSDAFSEDGKPLTDRVRTGGSVLLKELEWYTAALKRQREEIGLPK